MNSKNLAIVFSVVIVLSSFAGCIESEEDAETETSVLGKVMVSTYHVEQLVSAVAGESLDIEIISPSNVPVHDYEPSAADLIRLQETDLFFYHGLNLEPWVDSTISSLGTDAPLAVQTHTMPSGEETLDYESMLISDLCEHLNEGPYEATSLVADEDIFSEIHAEHVTHQLSFSEMDHEEDGDDDSDEEDEHDHEEDDHNHEEDGDDDSDEEDEHDHEEDDHNHEEDGDDDSDEEDDHNHEEDGDDHSDEEDDHDHEEDGDDHSDEEDDHDHEEDGDDHSDHNHGTAEEIIENPAGCPADSVISIFHLDEGEYVLEFEFEDNMEFNMTVLKMPGGHAHHDHGSHGEDHSDEEEDEHNHDHDEEDGEEHDHEEGSENHTDHLARYVTLHIEEEGDYGFALPMDVEFYILMDEDAHEGHNHGAHEGDICHNTDTHENYDSTEEECEAAGHMWLEEEGHDDHDSGVCHNTDSHENYNSTEAECEAAGHMWMEEHEEDEHESHNEELEYDPHSWLNPMAFKAQMNIVLETLVTAFPVGEADFRANAEAYASQLDSLDADFKDNFGEGGSCTSNKKVVANHNAYAYLSERYDIEFVTVHGIDPEGEPSAEDIAEAVEEINEEGLTVIYVEEYTDETAVASIVEQTGVTVEILYTMELPPKDSEDNYLSLMQKNLDNLVSGMGC